MVPAVVILKTGGHESFRGCSDPLSRGLFHLKFAADASMAFMALLSFRQPVLRMWLGDGLR